MLRGDFFVSSRYPKSLGSMYEPGPGVPPLLIPGVLLRRLPIFAFGLINLTLPVFLKLETI